MPISTVAHRAAVAGFETALLHDPVTPALSG